MYILLFIFYRQQVSRNSCMFLLCLCKSRGETLISICLGKEQISNQHGCRQN